VIRPVQAADPWPERGEKVSRQILVVEDSSSTRSLIVSTLEAVDGLVVTESRNGFEALKVIPQVKFDLIITDINMPDINGLELVSFVKKNPLYRDIPLIIVTTEGRDRDRERGMALGAEEYLVKPFDPEALQSLVEKYLKRAGSDGAATA
jgi:two-component system chemotaxis response regulator CheY